MLLLLSATAFSQQSNPSKPLTRADYLQKSKNQKTAGWILLGSGAVLSVTGLVIYRNSIEDSNNPFEFLKGKGAGASAIGFLAMAGSIPLFIASGKNRRKAEASVSFKMENATLIGKCAVSNNRYPAVGILVRL